MHLSMIKLQFRLVSKKLDFLRGPLRKKQILLRKSHLKKGKLEGVDADLSVGVDVGMGVDVKVFCARTHTHILNSSNNVFRLMNYSDIVSKHKNRFLSLT